MNLIKLVQAIFSLPKLIDAFNILGASVREIQGAVNALYEAEDELEEHEHATKDFDTEDIPIIIEGTEFLAAWWGLDHSHIGFNEKKVLKAITVDDNIAMFHSVQELKGYLRAKKRESKKEPEEKKDENTNK
jgi:hypothetical protein